MNRKPLYSSVLPILIAVTAALLVSGCLKTRSQIRDDGGDDIAAYPDKGANKGQYEVEEIKTELTRLNGRLEEIDHAQRNQQTGELKESFVKIEARVGDLEKNQVLIMSELKQLKDEKEAAQKEAAVPPTALISEGYSLLKSKKYDDAADKFKAAIAKGIKGKDAAEARFGLGEAEFGRKDFKKAIVQYSKVQEASPKSPRIAASLFKIGSSFQQLNMPKDAKGFFAELVERFPASTEAKKAKSKSKSKE